MTQGGDSVKHGSEIVANVVDDSGLNRNVLRRALERKGITRVLEVADGQECMSMMPELTPCHVTAVHLNALHQLWLLLRHCLTLSRQQDAA